MDNTLHNIDCTHNVYVQSHVFSELSPGCVVDVGNGGRGEGILGT